MQESITRSDRASSLPNMLPAQDTKTIQEQRKIRVLIIEKHKAVRRALAVRLGACPHLELAGTTSSPAMALLHSRAQHPDVIVFGIQNNIDHDLTATTVRVLAGGSADIIVLAPYADELERKALLQAGARRYLLKHIDSQQLIREIETVASSSRMG